MLLGAAAAEAQTSRILVSNSAQAADDSANTSGNDHAQLFHTGNHTNGYTLTSVHVNSQDPEDDDFDVEVCEEDGTSDEFPSTAAGDCTDLTAPGSFTTGVIPQFTHAGLALSANTNYVVVIKQRGTGSVELNSTPSGGEDTSIGLSDWSIKNKFYWKSGSTWMLKSGSNEALRIIVNGYANTVADATDATLSALSVSGATLSPAFAAATTIYHAVVANAVTQVTITETTSETTATVEYLDGSDATRTDADTLTAGLQVNLSVGSNTVKVKVTAPDTTTTETYTVNVFRVAVPVACSAASMPNRIWTGNLTVGGGDTSGFVPGVGYLDNTTFNFQGTTYTVNGVGVGFNGQLLSFALDNPVPNAGDVVLHIGDDQYLLADASVQGGNYRWTTNVPTWADGDAVCLALTVEGPAVSSVALTSDPGSDNTYGIGDDVTATVTFDAAVDITGTPQLALDFDGNAKAAACTAATNTTTMACAHTVVVNDSAPNGIAIGANKLTGGTIRATGSTTINAGLTHGAVMIAAGHKVDGIRPTLLTAGNDAPTTSTDGTKVILTFSETISSVARSLITIQANSVTAATSAASAAGDKVELTLTTALTATATNLTVALSLSAVRDGVGNGNLAVAATAVTNAIIANEPPEFSSPTATREAPENTAANTNIGTALPAATDADNDPLTYTLEGADAASFGFDPATRQLSTKSGVTYDHETKPSYSVTLKAEDDNGGSDTLAVTITVTDVEEPPDRPAAPSVTATAGTTDSLSVNWTAPSNTGPAIDNYDLRYREGSGGSWTNGPQNVSGTSATIGSLTESTSYQVQVLARNAEGDSPWSLPGSGQTGTLGAPDVPTGLDATPGNGQVRLSWVQPSGGAEVTHYEYELDLSGTWISTGGTATSTTVTGLTNGQTYTFRVRAVNSAGASAASASSASVTPATVPGAPTNLGATGGDEQVDLSWTAPASNGGARILRYEYELDFSGTWISTGGIATSHTVTGLTNDQSYTFRVRAVNRVGESAASGSQSATATATLVAPDTPFGLSATAGNQRVRLSWVQPSGGAVVTHYEYELDLSDTWISTGGTAPSTTVMGLTNDQSYTFRVRAVNSAGASGASGSQSATPTTTAPEAPESLSFTPGDGQVTLRWRAPTNDGGETILRYEYEQDGSGTWISTDSTATSHTVTGLNNGQSYTFRVRAVNALGNGEVATLEATPSPPTGGGGGGGGGGPRITVPSAPRNLLAGGGDGQVTLTWEAPEDDGGSAITDYEYRIDGKGRWISIGSTETTHTVTGLVNGQVYVFQVRAVNRNRKGRASNRVEGTPRMPVALDFAHFANGAGITSGLVFVNLSTRPSRPTLYFYDREGQLMDPESVVDLTEDLEVTEDGSLSTWTEMEPLGELTISTHGRGEGVSGSVKVVSDGLIGGFLRFDLPGIGVAGVGASSSVRDVLFPARRQAGGIRTAAALHNLGEEAMEVRCHLMSAGVALEEAEIHLEANGQTSWFIEDVFTTTDTSGFAGAVRCTAPGRGRFTAIAVEMDAAGGIFIPVPIVEVNRGRAEATTLDFAHFANGAGIVSEMVFVNLETQPSGPPLSPFHSAIPPSRPAIYFYDTKGGLVAAESVVDLTEDLEVTEDGALTGRTEMEPLGALTISTHGRGEVVSGSVKVVSDGPIGGFLRFDLPGIGVAGVGASPPVRDALFPARRQADGISTAAAIHNLGEEAMGVSCQLMQGGIVLEEAEIDLEANGQEARYIEEWFTGTDTSDFVGSVRCTASAEGEGMFTGVAVELDAGNRIFTTLPVVPVPERMSQE